MNFHRSFSEVASGKHKARPTNNPLARKCPFKPTPAFVQLVEENLLNHNAAHAQPKSAFRNGLRILFGECDQMLLMQIAEEAEKLYPEYTIAENKLPKGYVDLAFATTEIADAAANRILKVNGSRVVPTVRTRYFDDQNLFIGFTNLPDELPRDVVKNFLFEGLQCYGEIKEFELQRNLLFKKSGSIRHC